MLTSTVARERIVNMNIDEGFFDVGTDYNLLLVGYKYKVIEAERNKSRKKKKWCLRKADWEKYNGDRNEMNGVDVSEFNVMNDDIVESIRRVAKKSIVVSEGRVHCGKYNPWWSREIRNERKE